jgi:hypothetical protein
MNDELLRILDLIDNSSSIQVWAEDEELGRVSTDATEELKKLRGLIREALVGETLRCAAEIEGLPIAREADKPFRDFAVRVLRGLKIW